MMNNDELDVQIQLEKHKYYLDERKLLIQAEWAASAAYDRTMVTLSTGALAGSFLYIESFASNPSDVIYLMLTWISLSIALLLVLVALLTSERSMEMARDILEEEDDRGNRNQTTTNCYSVATNWLNRISLLFFATGILTLVIFVSCNVLQ